MYARLGRCDSRCNSCNTDATAATHEASMPFLVGILDSMYVCVRGVVWCGVVTAEGAAVVRAKAANHAGNYLVSLHMQVFVCLTLFP